MGAFVTSKTSEVAQRVGLLVRSSLEVTCKFMTPCWEFPPSPLPN